MQLVYFTAQVIGFQAFLISTHNLQTIVQFQATTPIQYHQLFLCEQLVSSIPILYWYLNRFIHSRDEIIACTETLAQSRPRSNGIETVLNTLQVSRSRVWTLDAAEYYTQETPFKGES